jgi:hypothetical protein
MEDNERGPAEVSKRRKKKGLGKIIADFKLRGDKLQTLQA